MSQTNEQMNEQINDATDTALWVAHYRAVETERPDALFRDPLAKVLVGERGKSIATHMKQMGNYTQWAVISRTLVIDRFISKLLSEGVDTVLNLGAGLDTRPYRMDLPAHLTWIEVDHPKIIDLKNERLKGETPKCHLQRLAMDLADGERRREFLNKINAAGRKIAVLTEGVIPYLSPEQVRELAEDLKAQPHIACWIAEYLSPESYKHLQRRLRNQKMKNAPFLFYPDDWMGFFEKSHWVPQEIQYTSKAAIQAGRRPPMPWFAVIFALLSSRAVKEKFMKMSGYVIFKKKA